MTKKRYNSPEATKIRISIEASYFLNIKGDELQVYQNFEGKINKTYHDVFNKWPDNKVKIQQKDLIGKDDNVKKLYSKF